MNNIFTNISTEAKALNKSVFIVGKYVLFTILDKIIYKYIDILIEGSVIPLLMSISKKIYHTSIFTYFRRFDTSRFKFKIVSYYIEFINSIKNRIIFTSFAISLNFKNYGLLIDNINCISINKPLYNYTVNIISSIRFSIELFLIKKISFFYIFECRKLIKTLSIEEIINEFNNIILSNNPSIGLYLLYETGILYILLPEVISLKDFNENKGIGINVRLCLYHKNNLFHTLEVLKNISNESNSLWLRWVALLHDIGKYITKKYINGIGWTFYSHEYIGSRLVPYLFHRLKFPPDRIMKYVQKLIQYSSHPIPLGSYDITESAVRRLLLYIGENIQDLLLLCKADITTKNYDKKNRYVNNFLLVEKRLQSLDIRDNNRSWLTSISGDNIMQFFKINPSPQIGLIKNAIKESILNGKLINNFYLIDFFMLKRDKKLNFVLEIKDI